LQDSDVVVTATVLEAPEGFEDVGESLGTLEMPKTGHLPRG
jgi:hypothetical protein